MSTSSFIQSVKRLMRVLHRPSRKEAWLLVKVSIIGVAALGVVGFIVRALFWIIGLSPAKGG
ncbi:MAG: protein translocase SEC61 complex subunit gamma [Candidatus Bathyarchaeia archaeon]